ncbi:MAG: hypothetical protein ACRDJY_00925 [Thermoleophilaceae bacterium]
MTEPVVVHPGTGVRTGNVEFLALTESSPRFNLSIITMAPQRNGPDLHVHDDEDDGFYVLDDEIVFILGDEEVTAKAGPSCWSHPATCTPSPTAPTGRCGC